MSQPLGKKRYIDLPPDGRRDYERLWGGRLPVDAEIDSGLERDGWVMISTTIGSRTAQDEDLLISDEPA